MTDAIKLAIDALEAGLDCAQEVAHRTHDELRGYKPHRHAAVDADVSKIEAALAALRARPASQYLCNGTPFKVAVRNGDAMLPYLPDELGGRWVALVAAEDDCHLRAQPDHIVDASEMVDHSELVKDATRYRAIRNGLEVDPNNSGIVVSLIDDFGGETLRGEQADKAIDDAMAAIGETME